MKIVVDMPVGLAHFFFDLWRQWGESDLPIRIDGWELEDRMKDYGLIVEEPYDPQKHGNFEEMEPGERFLMLSPAMKELEASLTPDPVQESSSVEA